MSADAVARELARRERATARRRRLALKGLSDCADRAAYVGLRRHPFLGLGGTALAGAVLGRFAPRIGLPPGLLGAGVRLGSSLVTRIVSGGIL